MKRMLLPVLAVLMACMLCACSGAITKSAQSAGNSLFSDKEELPAAEPSPAEPAAEPSLTPGVFTLLGTGWDCVEAVIDGEAQDPDKVASANLYMEFYSETRVYVSGTGSDFEADYTYDESAGVISITDDSGVTQTAVLTGHESFSLADPEGRMGLTYVHTYDLDPDDSEFPYDDYDGEEPYEEGDSEFPVEDATVDLSGTVWEMMAADMRKGGSKSPDGSLEFYSDGTGMFYYFGHSCEFEFYQYEDDVNCALIGHDKSLYGTLDADTMTLRMGFDDATYEISGDLEFKMK